MARRKVVDREVIQIYNTQGKAAAKEFIKTTYGVKDANYVLRRIKAGQSYNYDSDTDQFHKSNETPFMGLDELCVDTHKKIIRETTIEQDESIPDLQFDTVVQEMVKERFMEYARFIQSNSYERIWRINKSALQAAGYQLELY